MQRSNDGCRVGLAKKLADELEAREDKVDSRLTQLTIVRWHKV